MFRPDDQSVKRYSAIHRPRRVTLRAGGFRRPGAVPHDAVPKWDGLFG